MSESEYWAKHVEKIQAQSAAAIAEIQEGLAAQQGALEGIRCGIAPLENMKAEMLEAMNQMMTNLKLEMICDKRTCPPQLADHMASLDLAIMHPRPFNMSA